MFVELRPRLQRFLQNSREGIIPFSPCGWPPQGYTHTAQPSHFHLVNPQELFWVWPAFNPLFLPVQALPLYSPGALSSKETFEKYRLPIGQKSAHLSSESCQEVLISTTLRASGERRKGGSWPPHPQLSGLLTPSSILLQAFGSLLQSLLRAPYYVSDLGLCFIYPVPVAHAHLYS